MTLTATDLSVLETIARNGDQGLYVLFLNRAHVALEKAGLITVVNADPGSRVRCTPEGLEVAALHREDG